MFCVCGFSCTKEMFLLMHISVNGGSGRLGSRHMEDKLHSASLTLPDQEPWNECTRIVLQLNSQWKGHCPQVKTVKSILSWRVESKVVEVGLSAKIFNQTFLFLSLQYKTLGAAKWSVVLGKMVASNCWFTHPADVWCYICASWTNSLFPLIFNSIHVYGYVTYP